MATDMVRLTQLRHELPPFSYPLCATIMFHWHPGTRMKRRGFLGFVGGMTVWPVMAVGQSSAPPVIGLLSPRSLDDSRAVLAAFLRGLGETGYVEGKNVLIDYRWANGQMDRLSVLADDLVSRRVAVIAAVGGEPGIFAAKRSTSTIPIVFVGGSDPVKTGLVDVINRPSGNITGVTLHSNELEPKKLQLLRELVPQATTIAVLLNPQSPQIRFVRAEVETASASLGQKILLFEASTEQEIERAFAAIEQKQLRAVVVVSNPFFSSQRHQIISLAARHGLAAIFDSRIQVMEGGLISYGSSYIETYRQAGIYVGRVLRGAKPADLPVLFPSKFELAINLKTAKALSLTVPHTLLISATEIVE